MICLCDREIDGLVVKLWEMNREITITVRDERNGDNFAFEVEPEFALDAYYHPFAYRARAERTSNVPVTVDNDFGGNCLQ